MTLNYNKIDKDAIDSVKTVEDKLHLKYILYLFTKRYSPTAIISQLKKLCLSCPNTEQLRAYYSNVIDPLVKKHKLTGNYKNYRTGVMRNKGENEDFPYAIMDFHMEFQGKPDQQKRFLEFLIELDVADKWYREILDFYGEVSNLPKKKNGEPILQGHSAKASDTGKVLTCDRRYVIDRMILRKVPYSKISEVLLSEYKLKISVQSIAAYARTFFNLEARKVEEQMEILIAEKNALTAQKQTLSTNYNFNKDKLSDIDSMEMKTLIDNMTKRVEDVSETISWLNAQYSDMSGALDMAERLSVQDMFSQVMKVAFSKFMLHSTRADMESAKTMNIFAQMMATANAEIQSSDKNSQGRYDTETIISLVASRTEEIEEEIKSESAKNLVELGGEGFIEDLDPDDIAGLDGMSYTYMEENTDGKTEGQTAQNS